MLAPVRQERAPVLTVYDRADEVQWPIVGVQVSSRSHTSLVRLLKSAADHAVQCSTLRSITYIQTTLSSRGLVALKFLWLNHQRRTRGVKSCAAWTYDGVQACHGLVCSDTPAVITVSSGTNWTHLTCCLQSESAACQAPGPTFRGPVWNRDAVAFQGSYSTDLPCVWAGVAAAVACP